MWWISDRTELKTQSLLLQNPYSQLRSHCFRVSLFKAPVLRPCAGEGGKDSESVARGPCAALLPPLFPVPQEAPHPVRLYVEILTSRTSECDLIWKQDHCRFNYLRWSHTGVDWAPNPIWWCRYKMEEFGDRHAHRNTVMCRWQFPATANF